MCAGAGCRQRVARGRRGTAGGYARDGGWRLYHGVGAGGRRVNVCVCVCVGDGVMLMGRKSVLLMGTKTVQLPVGKCQPGGARGSAKRNSRFCTLPGAQETMGFRRLLGWHRGPWTA
jgi:hypothetical protein